MMLKLLAIFFTMVLTENYVLVQFIAICPFLGVSKNLDSSIGMSGAVIFVMTMASAVTWVLYTYVLVPFHLQYLQTIMFILVIAALIQKLLRFAGVQAFLSGVRPCVVGLILATALTMGLKTLFSFSNLGDNPVPDWRGILLFALMPLTAWGYKRLRKKPLSPILLILLSAGLGMLFYGL